jgi:hypothetical protein
MDNFDINNQDQIIQKLISGHSDRQSLEQRIKVGYITSIFRREVFEELGLFWENRFGSDAEFIERILFRKHQHRLPKNVFAQYFLSRVKSIDRIYERIDKILILSFVQGGQNLSQKHKEKERLAFQEKYRACFRGEFEYSYPRMES